ncbi:S-adenosyl-L-methionine-dependent methyltransferase, partial [Paraphoma chrysanthemicola]
LALVGLILDKMYSEVVFPNLRNVRKAPEPSQTYGELKYPVVSRLLADRSITEDSLVVDIGSGVGNVVLQVVLAYGCRVIGCELIEARHTVAQQLVNEGLQVASRDFSGIFGVMEDLIDRVELRQGDAFSDAATLSRLRVADLIICNNVKFPPDLLEKQISAVLGVMKSGATFVSFARIVMGKLTTRKKVLKALNVRERSYKGCIGDCSWKHEGVDYWVYTKKIPVDRKKGRP